MAENHIAGLFPGPLGDLVCYLDADAAEKNLSTQFFRSLGDPLATCRRGSFGDHHNAEPSSPGLAGHDLATDNIDVEGYFGNEGDIGAAGDG